MYLKVSMVRFVLCALFLMLTYAPMRAEAAKVPFLITTGDSITNIGQVPADAKPAIERLTQPGVEVGFVYSYFGLFWLDAWTWDGQYCLYQGKTIWKLTPLQAAKILGVAQDKLSTPLLYRFPSLLVLLVLGIIAMIVIGKFTKSDDEIAAELRKDERYQEAMTLFRDQYNKQIAQHLQGWLDKKWKGEGVEPARVERRVKELRLSFEPADIINEVMSFGSPTPVDSTSALVRLGEPAHALPLAIRLDINHRSGRVRVYALAGQMKCLQCLGESVAGSQADIAVKMRTEIRAQMRKGRTDDEILSSFADTYGQRVLLNPSGDGVASLVWVIPVVIAGLGTVGLALAFARWRRQRDDAGTTEVTDEDRALVDAALADGANGG